MKKDRNYLNKKEAGDGSLLKYIIADSIVKNAPVLLNLSVGGGG